MITIARFYARIEAVNFADCASQFWGEEMSIKKENGFYDVAFDSDTTSDEKTLKAFRDGFLAGWGSGKAVWEVNE